ncbi:MAG: ABC transporter permease subunit [Bradymonadia bacterium]
MRDQIHAVGYRPLEGRDTRFVPWPIARTALTLAWRRRATKGALLLCLVVFFGHALYLVGRMMAMEYSMNFNAGLGAQMMLYSVLGQTQEVLATFLHTQFLATALCIAVVGGGLVADDIKAGAFELYFARPIHRRTYAAGKLLAAATIPVVTILVPFCALWLIAVGISPEGQRESLWWLILPGLGGGLLATAMLACSLVGLSALGERGRTVGVVFVVALFALSGLAEGLTDAGFEWAGYLSPQRNVSTIAKSLLDVSFTSSITDMLQPHNVGVNPSALPSALSLLAFILAGLGALAARLRKVAA